MTLLRIPPHSVRERIDQLAARADSLEQQLIESQRLATLGLLSMTLAHEVNNQLMAIVNHADIALESDREEAMRRALDRIMANSTVTSTMIRNMLGFASPKNSQSQRMRASQLIEDTLSLMARDPAKDGIEVRRDCDESLWVEGPPVEMMQVLLNLVMNARQAMLGNGGTLSLAVRADGGFVALEIRDTGPGIPAENIDKIFDPFFTTKEGDVSGGGGTGLGLYISRTIAQQHGGDVAVVSRPGEGATFTVYLPSVEAPPEA